MAGFIPNEGAALFAQMRFKPTAVVDRGTNLQLLLFTNPSITKTITAAQLTEPTGGGYARKTLTDANWVIAPNTTAVATDGCVSTYPDQTFTPTTGGYTGTVYGSAIITTGTTPKILWIDYDPGAPLTITASNAYVVNLKLTDV